MLPRNGVRGYRPHPPADPTAPPEVPYPPLVLPSNHLIVGVTTAVNPVVVVNWSLNVFPPTSFAAVVILILYVVKLEKLDEGVIVKVLVSLEAVGLEAIFIQEEKLSEEIWKEPVQLVFVVFVVKLDESIESEKLTDIDELANTEELSIEVAEPLSETEPLSEIEVLHELLSYEVAQTVGAVVSSLKAYDSKAGMVEEIPRLL